MTELDYTRMDKWLVIFILIESFSFTKVVLLILAAAFIGGLESFLLDRWKSKNV
jgi:hypothetical protein